MEGRGLLEVPMRRYSTGKGCRLMNMMVGETEEGDAVDGVVARGRGADEAAGRKKCSRSRRDGREGN